MNRVFPIPIFTAVQIKQAFYPSHAPSDSPVPRLCRLYFGRRPDARASRFLNSDNFRLDAAQYSQLVNIIEELEEPAQVVYGMGEMLGRIHWKAAFDGRDIEFVIGGDGLREPTYYVIDFNQMRSWSRDVNDVSVLVAAHYQNDPYYPPARESDPLYQAFCDGYISGCGAFVDGATTFLRALSEEQTRRDKS